MRPGSTHTNMKFTISRLFPLLLAIACSIVLPAAASAKDEWIQVRSKNFFLIGNATEKDIRKTATKLEQFRETFRLLFKGAALSSPIPTNVVVFKSDSAFRPFKPKRADGKTDNFIAGFFQPGEDVNYITLSTEGPEADTYGTIFHEYVHSILDTNFGKSEVPTWFNEGLAEYYQTYAIEKDQEVKLGLPQNNHLMLLQQSKLMPLGMLFGTSNRALLQSGGHSRSIFYAQSWALVHYLIQGGKNDGLGKFLNSLVNNVPAEKAFQDAFAFGYADMEKELRKYVAKNSYQYQMFTFKNKMVFDADMQVSPLTEASSNAYLGDLLYHSHRWDDAEPLLTAAVAVDPDHTLTNTTLGMVKMRQRKYAEAKAFLETAVSADQKNHHALYRYAYLLSKESQDEFGWVKEYSPEQTAKMRELLKKAIAANPSFTESYELLAFVNMIAGDGLDEAVDLLKTALKHQPGNQRYALRIAEIYSRQRKFPEARVIAEKIAKTADDEEVRSRADKLADMIRQNEESFARYEEQKKQYENAVRNGGTSSRPTLIKETVREMTQEELEKVRAMEQLYSINASIRKPADGEMRVLGSIEKIECKGGKVLFAVKTDSESFVLTSKDFQGLELNTFSETPLGEVGCGGDFAQLRAVLSFKPAPDQKAATRGELVAVDFVPANFRFIEIKEATNAAPDAGMIETVTAGSPPPVTVREPADLEGTRRKMMLESIKQNLRSPAAGEVRALGFIEKSECSSKGMFFYFKVEPTQSLRLAAHPSRQPQIRGFIRDIEGLQFGCGMKAVDLPVVFTYTANSDPKAKTAGEIISLEFVPKGFVLD